MVKADITDDHVRLPALPHLLQIGQKSERGGQHHINIPKQRLGLVNRNDAGAW